MGTNGKHSSLGTRMKENYESRTNFKLARRAPVIIRIDGKAFHTYTKGLERPFDEGLKEDMVETTKYLCQNIMGAKCGYTQSDEISILLTDFDKLETQAWFDYKVQKITSIAASLATAKFNQLRMLRYAEKNEQFIGHDPDRGVDINEYMHMSEINQFKLALFDARVFQIPEAQEVVNYFVWRQQDAVRNSISSLAQSLYSQKELFKKNTSQMQEMCFQKGYNWNDVDYWNKRGSFIVKQTFVNNISTETLDDRGNKVLERFTDAETWAMYEVNARDWVDLVDPTIRTRWVAVETPTFSKDRKSISTLINKKT